MNRYAWPSRVLSVAEVRVWIASVLSTAADRAHIAGERDRGAAILVRHAPGGWERRA
jgi:hypothetical protein